MGLERVAGHISVPKHEIVPAEKVQEVTGKLGSSPDKFPQILSDDPAAIEIGAKRGDLIKITRASITAGTTVYFRVVV